MGICVGNTNSSSDGISVGASVSSGGSVSPGTSVTGASVTGASDTGASVTPGLLLEAGGAKLGLSVVFIGCAVGASVVASEGAGVSIIVALTQ